jgi:hypothetical protein
MERAISLNRYTRTEFVTKIVPESQNKISINLRMTLHLNLTSNVIHCKFILYDSTSFIALIQNKTKESAGGRAAGSCLRI